MANDVFANGREIACKKGSGKSICAFPDVVWTPPDKVPPTPTGVPVPYPNTAMASDTSKGTKKVKVSGKEAMLKNSSNFKKSMGDEAGVAQLKGFMTMKNRGKVYFTMWSMDVKFEGKNVVRHFDLATHNHGSMPGNAPPWPYIDMMNIEPSHPCHKSSVKEREACAHLETRTQSGSNIGKLQVAPTMREKCADTEEAKACREASKCRLTPFSEGCCDGSTPHHLVEVHGFMEPSGRKDNETLPQFSGYDQNKAPCVCASAGKGWENAKEGDHGFLHAIQGKLELDAIHNAPAGKKDYAWNYSQSKAAGIRAHQQTFSGAGCSKACLSKQLDAYHKQDSVGVKSKTPLRTETPRLSANQKEIADELVP